MRFIQPAEISRGVPINAWTTVDLTNYLGADAGSVAGVALYVRNISGANNDFGARKQGSTSTLLLGELHDNSFTTLWVGVDSNDELQLFREDMDVQVFVYGYVLTTEAEFYTDPVDKTPGSASTWTATTLTSPVATPQIVLGFTNNAAAATRLFGVAPTGGTQRLSALNITTLVGWAMMCDGSGSFGLNTANTADCKAYVTGYIHANAVSAAAVLADLTTPAVYQDLDLSATLPSGATAVLVRLGRDSANDTATSAQAWRRPGDEMDLYHVQVSSWSLVPCTASRHIEVKFGTVAGTSRDNVRIYGYTTVTDATMPSVQTDKVDRIHAGGVTTTAARVIALLTGASADVVLRCRLNGSGAPIDSASVAANSTSKLVDITITGLSADSEYTYNLVIDGVEDTEQQGTFKTNPTSGSFAFGVGNCNQLGTNVATWDHIAGDADVRMFMHLGDWGYPDYTGTTASIRRQNLFANLSQPKQRAMTLAMWRAYIYGDHDFGNNNSSGFTSGGVENAYRDPAVLNYRTCVPSHTLADAASDAAVYHSFVIGRVRFIVFDLRADFQPTVRLISSAQRTWFTGQVQAAKAAGQVLCLCSEISYIGGSGSDGWDQVSGDRQFIEDELVNEGMENSCFMIAGDMHSAAWDDGGNNAWGGFPVFHAGPINQTSNSKGGPYDFGPTFSAGLIWGKIEVVDVGGSTIDVEFTAFSNGTPITGGNTTVTLDVPFTATATNIDPSFIDAAPQVFQPFVEGPHVIDPQFIAPTATVPTPGIGAGIQPTFISTTSFVSSPTVISGLVVEPGFISSPQVMHAPNMGGGDDIEVDAPAAATAAVFAPLVSQGSTITVNIGGIASPNLRVFAPIVMQGSTGAAYSYRAEDRSRHTLRAEDRSR